MFFFRDSVPASLHGFLVPYLQAWIGRNDQPLFAFETTRYGLITFRREPWPTEDPIWVSPAGEVDEATLHALATDMGV